MNDYLNDHDTEKVLNRLEELDIILLDHNGCPISFTQNFSNFIDGQVCKYEANTDFGIIIKQLFRIFTKNKIKYKNEQYEKYYIIIAQILLLVINDICETCEDYRIKVINELNL